MINRLPRTKIIGKANVFEYLSAIIQIRERKGRSQGDSAYAIAVSSTLEESLACRAIGKRNHRNRPHSKNRQSKYLRTIPGERQESTHLAGSYSTVSNCLYRISSFQRRFLLLWSSEENAGCTISCTSRGVSTAPLFIPTLFHGCLPPPQSCRRSQAR